MLQNNMKEELLNIYNEEIKDLSIKALLLTYVEDICDSYNNQTKVTKDKLTNIFKTFSTNTDRFSSYENPGIILYHGADSYKVTVCTGDSFDFIEDLAEFGTVVLDLVNWGNDVRSKVNIENQEKCENWLSQIRTSIFYTWLSSIWFEIDGQNYDIILSTCENSVIREFVFNDMSWMAYSNYQPFTKRKIEHFKFGRPLSILEIYRRINLGSGFYWYKCEHRKFFSNSRIIDMMIGDVNVFVKEQGQEIQEYIFNDKIERNQWIKCKADEMLLADMVEQYK